MSRRPPIVLILLALLWQPLSAMLPAGCNAGADRIGHAVAHQQALAHHHHDDATLQLGDDEPAHQHVLDGLQLPALTARLEGSEPLAPPSGIDAADVPLPPSADPQHLLRPPRPGLA